MARLRNVQNNSFKAEKIVDEQGAFSDKQENSLNQQPKTQLLAMRPSSALRRLGCATTTALVLALTPVTKAQVSNFWNSTVDGALFTDPGNWVDAFSLGGPGAVPTGNEVAVFGSINTGVDTNFAPLLTNFVNISSDVAFGRLLITTNGFGGTGLNPISYRFGGSGSITLSGDGAGTITSPEVITVSLHANAFNPTISNNIWVAVADGRINVNGGRTLNLAGNIGGTGAGASNPLILTNTGTLRLTGSNLMNGIVTRAGGVVNVNAAAGLGIAPAVFTPNYISLWNGSTLTINTNATTTGGGLDGGNFTINSNMGITVGHTAAGAATININNGIVTISQDNQLRGFGGANNTNRLLKAGAGTLVLEGVQDVGRFRINAGTLQANAETALGSVPASPVFDYFQITNVGGLALNFTGELNANRGIALGFTNNNVPWTAGINVVGTNVVTYGGIIRNMTPTGGAQPGHNGHFVKGGGGTLVFNGASGQHLYTGITRIDAGYLTDDSLPWLPTGSQIVYNGGGLLIDTDYTITDPNIVIGSNNNARAVFFVGDGATVTFNGGIINNWTNPALGNAGGGANNILSKNGPGTMILGGNLTHFGGIESSNGVLWIKGLGNTYTNITHAAGAGARIGIDSDANLGLTSRLQLNNGGLLVTNDVIIPLSRVVTVGGVNNNNGAIFEVGAGATLTIDTVLFNLHSNNVSAGGITKLGPGTLLLNNTNIYGGATTIRDGTLSVTQNEALGSQAQGAIVDLGGGVFTNFSGRNAGMATNLTISKGSLVLNGTTQTVGAITLADNNVASEASSTASITGPGTLRLSGNITYNGGVTTNREAGPSSISADIFLLGNRTFTVQDSPNAADELTITGGIYGDSPTVAGRTLTKAGTGVLVLASPVGVNNFSNLTINAGTVKLGANDQLPNGRTVTVQSSSLGATGTAGVLDINGKTDAIGALTLGGGGSPDINSSLVIDSAGGGLLSLGGALTYVTGPASNHQGTAVISANLSLGGANRTANIADSTNAAIDLNITGSISGANTLTVTNSGTLRLAGANTFTSLVVSNVVNPGPTVLNDGSHAGNVTVGPNGTFGGSGSVAGTVTVLDGGALSPGSSPGTLTVGTLVLSDLSVLNYELGYGPDDLIAVTGALTLNGILNVNGGPSFGPGIYTLMTYGGLLVDNGVTIGSLTGNTGGFGPGDLFVDLSTPGQVNLVVVPEPSTVALAGIGAALLGLHVIRRRRRNSR